MAKKSKSARKKQIMKKFIEKLNTGIRNAQNFLPDAEDKIAELSMISVDSFAVAGLEFIFSTDKIKDDRKIIKAKSMLMRYVLFYLSAYGKSPSLKYYYEWTRANRIYAEFCEHFGISAAIYFN